MRLRHSRRPLFAFSAVLFLTSLLTLTACTKTPQPAMDARDALGTIVTVTAYPAEGHVADDLADALDAAYDAMDEAEAVLDAHSGETTSNMLMPGLSQRRVDADAAVPATSVADFDSAPNVWRMLPPEVVEVLDAIEALDVEESFSPSLLEVVALYDFEGKGSVPDPEVLEYYLAASRTLQTTETAEGAASEESGVLARFDWSDIPLPESSQVWGPPARIRRAGLDLGGAAKGYAIDRAVEVLRERDEVAAALVTAGSTTVTFGKKPDGEPWRIGIEDPRDTDSVVAVVEAEGNVTVSTSGDYQRYFERDGVRYHHIIDPATGKPARGLRSLTVIGAADGLDSDILATALFVMGEEKALRYAEENGLGLVTVNDEGRVHIAPGPEDRTWQVTEESR